MVGADDGGPALWEWESGAPRHDPVTPRPRDRRPPQDTPEGCRAMAAADMARAGRQAAGWPRTRFEHSAVMWSRRAMSLEHGDD